MKKNGQYVGVDEKYIPEEEKYVDNEINGEIKDSINDGLRSVKNYVSDKDNQQKFKNTGKKGLKILKGIGIGYLALIGFIIVMVIVIFVIVFVTMGKTNNKTDEIINQASSIIDKVTDEIDDNSDNSNSEGGQTSTNQYNQADIMIFNSSFEFYNGMQSKFSVSNLLEDVVTNNKTKKEHIITVVCDGISTTNTDEIRTLKQNLVTGKNYEISLDYDTNGFVNKITIE